MFEFKNVAVIYLRMFLSILSTNLTLVNKKLSGDLRDVTWLNAANENSITLFIGTGVGAYIVKEMDFYYLHITTSLELSGKMIKLGRTPTISKSVMNSLEVWFHKEYRPSYFESINLITESIKLINIKPFIQDIGWLKRLTFAHNVKDITYKNRDMDTMLQTRVTVQRGLTNRLQVFVDIHTGNIKGALTTFIPVHAGIMRSYTANVNNDPVNKWLQEVMLEHVDLNLK